MERMMLELRPLQLAIALGRYRSYTRTAEAMHISQPALSRSIASLEDILGVRLFDRGRRRVEPTAFGRLVLARGELLLREVEDLRRDIGLMQGLEIGDLKVAAAPIPSEMSIGPAIARLISAHPDIRVDIHALQWRQTIEAVLRGEVDVGVVDLGEISREERLHSEPLPKHPLYFFCRPGHPLTLAPDLIWAAIRTYPLATIHVRHIPQLAESTGRFDPQTGDFVAPIRVGSIALAKQIVATCDAISGAPLYLIEPEIRAGSLVVLPFHEPWMETTYGMLTLRGRTLSPVAEAFMETLRAVEKERVVMEARVLESFNHEHPLGQLKRAPSKRA